MPKGNVLSYNHEKGYGFIRPDDASANVYVHISAITAAGLERLEVGQPLSYELFTDDDNKTSAINIADLS